MPLSFEPTGDPEFDAFREKQNKFRKRKVEKCEHEWQPVSMVFESRSSSTARVAY